MKKKIALLLICLMAALALTACPRGDGDPDSLVITPPTKVTYIAGTQSLDLAGGKVAVKYTKGKVKDETDLSDTANVTVECDLRVAGTVKATVTYQTLSATFDVTVVPAEDAKSIEITKEPYKKSYGPYVSESHVRKLGGEIAITYSTDKEPITLPMSDPLVSVLSVDTDSKKITVLCYGLTDDYEYTLDDKEIGYITITKQPDRTFYRENASTKDVDLGGGEYSLELKGKVMGNYSFDDKAHKVEPIAIGKNKDFVTFERSLNSVQGYEGQKVTGYLDITTVSTWPARIKSVIQPEQAFYLATQDEESIDLEGVEVEIEYQNASGTATETKKLTLPNDFIKVDSIKLDANDEYTAHVTLEYKDKIATSQKIMITVPTKVVEDSHTEVTLFDYYVEQLPEFEKIAWSRTNILTTRQKTIAKEAVNLYIHPDTNTAKIDTQAKTVLAYGFYVEWVENRYELFDKLNAEVKKFSEGTITEATFLSRANAFAKDFKDFEDKYKVAPLKDVVTSRSVASDGKVTETKVSSRLESAVTYKNRQMMPFISGNAIAIAEDVTAAIDNAGIDQEDWKAGITVTDADIRARHPDEGGEGDANIEAAYALLSDPELLKDEPDKTKLWDQAAWDDVKCATQILRGWRPDALEIIYAYYYDDSHRITYETVKTAGIYIGATYDRDDDGNILYYDKDGKLTTSNLGDPKILGYNNKEIFNLMDHDIIAPLIEETYPMLFDLTRYVSFNENTFFMQAHAEYLAHMKNLWDNYPHKVTVYAMQTYRISAYYNPAQLNTAYESASILQTAPLIDWAGYADTYYRGMLTQTVRKEYLASANVLALTAEHVKVLRKYVPSDPVSYANPFPVGDATFDAEFVKVFELFDKLTHLEKGVFLQYADIAVLASKNGAVSPTTGKTLTPAHFTLMMDSFMQSKVLEGAITQAEYELYRQLIETYTLTSFICFDGLTTSRLDSFNNLFARLNTLYEGIQGLSTTFTKYCGEMYELCNVTSASFEKITTDMHDLINQFYKTNSHARSHKNTGNDIAGFRLITSLKEFDGMMADWKRVADKDMTHLNVIKLAGKDMGTLYKEVKEIYDKSYGKYGKSDSFQHIFRVGEKWLIEKGLPDAYDFEKAKHVFEADAKAVLEEFGSKDRYTQFLYVNASSSIFSGIISDYYEHILKMDGKELKWVEGSVYIYYIFLILDFAEESIKTANAGIVVQQNKPQNAETTAEIERLREGIKDTEELIYGERKWNGTELIKDPDTGMALREESMLDLFIENMKEAIADYNALSTPLSQKFHDTNTADDATGGNYKVFGETIDGSPTVWRDMQGLYDLWKTMYDERATRFPGPTV